jgi:transcriptional regulator with XRE-family HTH domain
VATDWNTYFMTHANDDSNGRGEAYLSNVKTGLALRAARKQAWGGRGSLSQAAEIAGVSPALLSQIERGDHPISKVRSASLARFPDAYGMTALEFSRLTGVSLIDASEMSQTPPDLQGSGEFLRPVLRLSSRSLGPNDLVSHEYVAPEHAGVDLIVGAVADDAMAPEFQAGDWVYLDRKFGNVVEGKVYLVQSPEGYVLRRLRAVGSEKVLMADNPSYPTLPFDKSKMVGRVYYCKPHGRVI